MSELGLEVTRFIYKAQAARDNARGMSVNLHIPATASP